MHLRYFKKSSGKPEKFRGKTSLQLNLRLHVLLDAGETSQPDAILTTDRGTGGPCCDATNDLFTSRHASRFAYDKLWINHNLLASEPI